MDIGRVATSPRACLDYPEIRNQIQDGDILLFRGKSWLSRLICRLTGSPYSHSGIVGWWSGRLMVFEAGPTGVVASRMSLVVSKYSGKVELWTTDDNLARFEVIRAAQRLLGKRYSKFKLLRDLQRRWFGRSRPESKPKSSDPEAPPEDFVCSEFVSRMWRAGGIELAKQSPDLYPGPRDIAKSPNLRKVGDLVRGRPGAIVSAPLQRLPQRSVGAR